MKMKLVLIPGLCLGSLISAAVLAEGAGSSPKSAAPSAEIKEAEAMAEESQATATRGEVRTNAYWDEEEENSANEVVEVEAGYEPDDDTSPAELQAGEEGMPAQRRYREEITVEELRPDD